MCSICCLAALSQEENESGRFLREKGSVDKTKAGKMMISVGKALSYTAQQRYVTYLLHLSFFSSEKQNMLLKLNFMKVD